ncbi:MAG TPA: ThuA domain-containing protein, partial [Anseongella sp.]|nr:ThuA domain-containing protein [Anseongella sp.]
TCHSIGGEGKFIGPDLSNLIYRDYSSVLRDISDPSATINPDYLAHTVTLKDGRKLTGFMSYKKDSVVVRDITGNKTTVPEQDVVSNVPVSSSLMPPGLDKMLGEEKMKDLMTYLLTSMQPADLVFPFLPPIRKNMEAEEVLKRSAPSTDGVKTDEPFNILWVSGPKDHGPDEHDYPLQQKRWARLLSLAENVEVDTVNGWPDQAQFDKADVVVFYWNYQAFNEENGKQLDAFLAKGGGLVYLHYAVDATQNPEALANRIGLAWKGGHSKFRHGRQPLDFGDTPHPITRGFESTVFEDESYWELIKGNKEINLLASGHEEGKPIPMLWTVEQGKGRVFVSILGHFNWTFDDPLFRILLLRGISWAGNRPTDEMIDIVNMGARVSK